VFVPSQA
jgi:putative addiction module killer protein